MKPFLNWPGGKTRLIGEISKRYPKNLGWGYNRYVEPFVGGGAVLVDILSSDWYCNVECVINDIEPKLINAYMVIKYNVYDLRNIGRTAESRKRVSELLIKNK